MRKVYELLEERTGSGEGLRCLSEEDFAGQMKTLVEPFLASVKKAGELPVSSGRLYYELYPQQEKADTVVICHGFSESTAKYQEFIYYLYQAGFQVVVYDQRGHGKSFRMGEDANVVHVEDFYDYVEDLHCLIEQVVKAFAGDGALYLYAHSMGGCTGALYLEHYPGDFAKAVLNAPMLAIQMGACPLPIAKGICDLAKLFGRGKKRLFVHGEFNPEEPFSQSCSDSGARHAYYLKLRRKTPCYRTSSASYAWGSAAIKAGCQAVKRKNASRITIPVLLFQAGKDNQVRAAAQENFIKQIEKGRLMKVPSSKHEIYRARQEVLEPYMEKIRTFFGNGRYPKGNQNILDFPAEKISESQ